MTKVRKRPAATSGRRHNSPLIGRPAPLSTLGIVDCLSSQPLQSVLNPRDALCLITRVIQDDVPLTPVGRLFSSAPPTPGGIRARAGTYCLSATGGELAHIGTRNARSGHWIVIGCRATQSCTRETCGLLQRPSSICPCRRAAGHQVQEVACTGSVAPTPVLFRPATQLGFSRTI